MYQGLVVHHIPGRLRLRLPFLKGFSSSSEQIKNLISPFAGIKKVDFNPITGSALISYDPEQYGTFLEQLEEYTRNSFGLTLITTESTNGNNHRGNGNGSPDGQSELARLLVNSFKRLDEEMSEVSENGVDLKSLLPVSLAAYALFNIGSAATTPLWVTLGLFSFTAFVSLHPAALNESVHKEQRKKRRPKVMSHHINSSS